MIKKKLGRPKKNSIITRNYGWRPSLPDVRDWTFESLGKNPTLPISVDLRKSDSPVEDQGQLGSCTANALTAAIQFIEKKDKDVYAPLSRLFVYYNERAIEGTISSDSGAQIRDGIKTLNKQGVCPETEWPYTVSKFKTKPTTKCFTDALKNVIVSYYSISTLTAMKTCLASGYPFVFGFTVYTSFESDTVATTGIVNLPIKGESVLGGHAVLCVGYDDITQRFIVRNSWGTSWGQKGYFTIPYTYLTNSKLASDFWYITKDKTL